MVGSCIEVFYDKRHIRLIRAQFPLEFKER